MPQYEARTDNPVRITGLPIYRLCGIPKGLDKAGAKDFLLAALETQDLAIDSFAAASSKQVATIGKSLMLKDCENSKRPWQVSAHEVSMTVDTHSAGFTPLNYAEGDKGSVYV